MRIGVHVGVGQGWVEAARYGKRVGAECLQVFTKSPRMWRATPLPDEALAPFAAALAEHDVAPVYAHTSYLINLGSDDPVLRARSIEALAEEFRRAAAIRAQGLVTHLGTDAFDDRVRAAEWIADAISSARVACASDTPPVTLLLENAAGAGRQYGASMEEVGGLLREVEARDAGPVGVCFDTCHGFAAGYDLSSEDAWTQTLGQLQASCGRDSLVLIHANDCMFERGERRDRHAWIGDGHLGEEAFRSMFCLERLSGVDVIAEMPGEVPEKDEVNTDRLKRLRAEAVGGLRPR